MRLLLAEDEGSLSRAIVSILKKNNFEADAADNGADALDYLLNGNYDGTILDIMMPKMDGISVLKKVREAGLRLPILMLTAKAEIDDKVLGLDSGANDYLTKPFATRELLARIRAMLRVQSMQQTSKLMFGNITLDCAASLSFAQVFLRNSIAISAAGFLMVLLLLIFFSGRIIKPVAQSYEKQKRFITDAGHELKTPVTIIDADAELLEMDLPDSEWLADIRNQTKRLSALTHDLIYLSRLEEQNQLTMIEFPLSDAVSECAASFQALAKTQNKAFTTAIEPMISFCGDENSLLRLVFILLDNAVKYSNEAGDISLRLERQGKRIRLTVENRVDSIDPQTLDNLFERFYRADSARGTQSGYGIGLSIARAIVTAHKGKITAYSPEGNSLVITVLLPG